MGISPKQYRKELRAIISKKRNKYGAIKTEVDGIKFDSKMEAEYYQILKASPETIHIDCHVPVTLPGGIRYKVDFIVWEKYDLNPDYGDIKPRAIEIKGKVTQDFRTKRKLFDAFHPLRPLEVYTKKSGKWVEI